MRSPPRPSGVVALAGALAALLGGLLVALLPRGGDTAAHLYRTELVEDGVLLWDTFWYGGHYPLAGYSGLYHPLAAVVGNVPLALAASALSAALFASIALRAWGRTGRWPALAFALVAPAPVLLGQWPYAAGLAAALGAVRALQARRTALAVAASALALAFSPLAFALLCLVLAGALLVRPEPVAHRAAVAAALVTLAALQVLVLELFSAAQEFVFPAEQLPLALAAVVPVAALALLRMPRDPLAAVLGVWVVAILVAFAAPVPLGENVTRPRWLLFPVALAVALRVRFRPRVLAALALAAAFLANAVPYASFVRGAPLSREHDRAFWAPLLALLDEEGSPEHRVEVVPTASHWEALYVPQAGHALARGWFRQLDLARNGLLYEEALEPTAYRAWLRANAVRYVAVPRIRLDQRGAEAEARLLASGRSGLEEVLRTDDWTVWELPAATPLLTGPGPGRVTVHEHDRIEGRVGAAGTYLLRVRFTPFWHVLEGDVCVLRTREGATLLRFSRPGRFALGVRGGPDALASAATGAPPAAC